MNRLALLINPTAGRGRGKRLLEKLRSRFSYLEDAQFLITERAGDEARLAAYALQGGCSILLVVGGDGTCSQVANVLIESKLKCALTVVPCGTGNDFAKILGVWNLSVDEIAGLVERGEPQSIDVGRMGDRYFLNTCGFGFDASVLEASRHVRLLRGDAVYIYSALKQLFTYPGVDVTVNGDGRRERILMAVVSNGRYLGGAFKIAPQASVTDGELDINVFKNCGPLERAQLFASAMKGTHGYRTSTGYGRSARFTLDFLAPPGIEMDGELRHAASPRVEIECIPRALPVIAAPGAIR